MGEYHKQQCKKDAHEGNNEPDNLRRHRRQQVGHYEDRLDEKEGKGGKGSIQQIGKFVAVDNDDVDLEPTNFLFDVASHHFPKLEDSKYFRRNFKQYVLPLMTICTMPVKSVIYRCGERGTCTYLVTDGQLEVHDEEGNVVNTLQRGAMFGESSMLYDCSRSETVICAATTTLWRLNRSAYYALQKIINSPALSVNAKRLFEVIPEVVVLPLEYKEKLMLRIAGTTFTNEMKLYEEDKCSTRVMVIEDGYVNIHFSSLFLRRSPEDLLRELGISVDLNQCRRDAEDQVITWEDILHHPISERQLKERDGHEGKNVAIPMHCPNFVTISSPSLSHVFPHFKNDESEGHTDGSRDSFSPTTTPPKRHLNSTQSSADNMTIPMSIHRHGVTPLLSLPTPLLGLSTLTCNGTSSGNGNTKLNNSHKSTIQHVTTSLPSSPRKHLDHIPPISMPSSPSRSPFLSRFITSSSPPLTPPTESNVIPTVIPRTRTGRLFGRNARSLSPATLPPMKGTPPNSNYYPPSPQ